MADKQDFSVYLNYATYCKILVIHYISFLSLTITASCKIS